MGLLKVVLLCLVFSVLCFKGNCDDGSEYSVKFLKAPHAFSHLSSAKFVFEVLQVGNGSCSDCSISCRVSHIASYFFLKYSYWSISILKIDFNS